MWLPFEMSLHTHTHTHKYTHTGGAAESVAEGDNLEGGGGTIGGRGGEEAEVGSGSREAGKVGFGCALPGSVGT